MARINSGPTIYWQKTLRETSHRYVKVTGARIETQGLYRGFNRREQPNINVCIAESWAMHEVNPEIGFAPEGDTVTQWYCDMFLPDGNRQGLERIQGLAANAGLEAGTIIQYDASIADNEEAKRLFERAFRKIASNPVGRMLLYRLLIEIYRIDENEKPCQEKNITTYESLSQVEMKQRNDCRCLHIANQKDKHWMLYEDIDNMGNYIQYLCVGDTIFEEENSRKYLIPELVDLSSGAILTIKTILTSDGEIDAYSILLFHELTHWFHRLRNLARYDEDGNWVGSINLSGHRSLSHFWSGINQSLLTEEQKIFWLDDYGNVAFEEVRTILGGYGCEHYVNGDEISENAYRQSIGWHLRYGHSKASDLEGRPANCDMVKIKYEVDWINDILP